MVTPKINRASIAKAVESLLESGARSAVVYQHPQLRVKATRRFKPSKRNKNTDVVLTIGRPNYRERKIAKRLLDFPSSVQLRFYPKK